MRLPSVLLFGGAALLAGCGSASSTPLAPDAPEVNVDKMSAEQRRALIDANTAEIERRKRNPGAVAPGSGPAGP